MLELLFFPFAVLGSVLSWVFSLFGLLIGFFFALFGRVLSLVVGLALCVAGVLACLSVVGLFIGIPLLLLGGALILRCLF